MPLDSTCQHLDDARHARRGIRGWFAASGATLTLWRKKSRERRELGELDDQQLADIGITRVDAQREAQKWFWR
jgi:uncharacterized protein YjiS (DUF1127 family)